jgi:hypothetical protein
MLEGVGVNGPHNLVLVGQTWTLEIFLVRVDGEVSGEFLESDGELAEELDSEEVIMEPDEFSLVGLLTIPENDTLGNLRDLAQVAALLFGPLAVLEERLDEQLHGEEVH